MPQALHEEAPLQPEGGQEQVDAHAAETVALEEGHEEPEANEDHDMNILEHWRKKRWGQFVLIVKQASALCQRGSDVGLRAIKVNQIKCWKCREAFLWSHPTHSIEIREMNLLFP